MKMRILAIKPLVLRQYQVDGDPGLNKKQKGFTLLELLVVLSIMALVATLVIPAIGNSDASVFSTEVRKAFSTLNYARRMALIRSSPQVATFLTLDSNDAGYAELKQEVRSGIPLWESKNVGLRFQLDQDQNPEALEKIELTFFPEGGSTGGILNFALGSLAASIKVDAITGRISSTLYREEAEE